MHHIDTVFRTYNLSDNHSKDSFAMVTGLGKLDHMRLVFGRLIMVVVGWCCVVHLRRRGGRRPTGRRDGVDFLAAKMAGLRYPSLLCGLKVLYVQVC